MLGGAQNGFCACDSVRPAKVEVATLVSVSRQVTNRGVEGVAVPMVGDVDGCLSNLISGQFDLILYIEDVLRNSILLLLVRGIPDTELNRARIAFIAMRTDVGELHAFSAVSRYRDGTRKYFLAPPFTSAMEGMLSIVLTELIGFAIQIVDYSILDAIGDASDSLTEERTRLVRFCSGEAEHNVMTIDIDLLDQRAVRQEGECRFGRHAG